MLRRALVLGAAAAERAEHLVTSLPGFPDADTWGFEAYSGILDVPGYGGRYDALRIHFQFHTSRRAPSADPVTVWHQGGPGSSSITIGLFNELGALTVGEEGNYVNPHAWNRVSNVLYLESPAGSGGGGQGFSECVAADGSAVDCSWDDGSQAEAYAYTLRAFFEAFPEYAQNDLYLAGESYFGQYGPNIAKYILDHEPFSRTLKLKGMALGNSCWGGTETHADCAGPNADMNLIDLLYGKGLFSPKTHRKIMANCLPPNITGDACLLAISQMTQEVGPYNVYNVYDNCGETAAFLHETDKDLQWLRQTLRAGMHNPGQTHAELTAMNGGYSYDCMSSAYKWIVREDVKKALHLDGRAPGRSLFYYGNVGPASITLYPELAQKIRILLYSGDADTVVPYTGTEDMILGYEENGILKETSAWAPWFASGTTASAPAGYITRYQAPGSSKDFSFATIRLAGHMAPQVQPEATLALISSFLAGDWLAEERMVV